MATQYFTEVMLITLIFQIRYIHTVNSPNSQGRQFLEHPTLNVLIHNLNLNWVNYSLHIDSPNLLGIEVGYLSSVKVVSSNSENIVFPAVTNYRFISKFQTILFASHTTNTTAMNSVMVKYRNYTLSPHNMFVFLSFTNLPAEFSEWIKNLPVVKLVFYMATASENLIEIICNLYCDARVSARVRESNIWHIPAGLHKLLFKNGNQRVFDITAPLIPGYFEYVGFPFICTRRIYFAEPATGCSSYLTAVLVIEQIHNMTLRYVATWQDSGWRSIEINENQYVSNSMHANIGQVGADGLYLQETQKRRAFYCVTRNEFHITGKRFKWFNPFQTEIWLLTFLAITVSSIYVPDKRIKISFFRRYFLNFTILIGEQRPNYWRKKKVAILLSACGMVLKAFYGENTKAITVKGPGIKQYGSLEGLLNDGYKIAFEDDPGFDTAFQAYEDTFRIKRLSHLINTSFYIYPFNSMVTWQNMCDILNRKNAFVNAEKISNLLMERVKCTCTQSQKDIKCSMVSETIETRQIYFEIFTMNRSWIRMSISKLKQAGLLEQWDKWVHWRTRVADLLLRFADNANEGINLIDFHSIKPVLIAWCIGNAIFLLLFSKEMAESYVVRLGLKFVRNTCTLCNKIYKIVAASFSQVRSVWLQTDI